MIRAAILLITLLLIPSVEAATVKAFPSAEGYGANSVGGRGGTVYKITNLNDSGAGSLRACVEASGPRVCIFETGGTIALQSTLSFNNPYITIAGQTAPGGGISVKNESVRISTHDVIIRHFRSRPGLGNVTIPPGRDLNAMYVAADGPLSNAAHDIILDHCTAAWSTDQNLDSYAAVYNVTFQWCIIAEGTLTGHSSGQEHNKGTIHGNEPPYRDLNNTTTIHHSLYAHLGGRNPLTGGYGIGWDGAYIYADPALRLDFINNIVYNWSGNNAAQVSNSFFNQSDWNVYTANRPNGHPTQANFIGNHYIMGPNSSDPAMFDVANKTLTHAKDNISNYCPTGCDGSTVGVNWSDQQWIEGPSQWHAFGTFDPSPFFTGTPFSSSSVPVTTQASTAIYDLVLNNVGATVPQRDSMEAGVVASVRTLSNRAAQMVYPTLAAGTPPTDTDGDGMPDAWETAHGLNPNSAADGPQTAANGYTNLENYLNQLAGDITIDYTLSLASSNPASACAITVLPLDTGGNSDGSTPFTRTYSENTSVSLTAALTCGGNDFQKWQKGGVDHSTAAHVDVTIDSAFTMTAVYVSPTQPTSTLTIQSSPSGAQISVSPNDNNGLNSCTTPCDRVYNTGTVVTITARPTSHAPLLWYPMEEGAGSTTADSSSNIDLTLLPSGTATWVTGDQSAYGIAMDGTSHSLAGPDTNLLTNITEWTYAIRAKPSRSLSDYHVLMAKNDPTQYTVSLHASGGPFGVCTAGVPFVYFTHTNGTGYRACDTTPLPVDAWSRVRATCSGTTLSIMRNGAVTNTSTVPSCAIKNAAGGLELGGSHADEYFPGALDDARIYGRPVADDDNPGDPFTSWTDCDSANGRVCTQTLGGNETVTATFTASGVTLTQSAFKIYDLGKNGSSLVDITSIAKVIKGGSAIIASQIDATGENPPTTTLKLKYNRNAGAYTDLPNTPGADNISWHGATDTRNTTPAEGDPVASCLSGALTPFSGTTSRTVTATPSFDVDQDSCIVNRAIVKFTTSASGIYCFRYYNLDDTAITYGGSGTACVTVTDYNSSGT